MEFEVTEIKMLGQGIGRSLSLRLDAISDARTAQSGFTKSAYTIHAVVPFSPEFGNVQVGQKFNFERSEEKSLSTAICNVGTPHAYTRDCEIKCYVRNNVIGSTK